MSKESEKVEKVAIKTAEVGNALVKGNKAYHGVEGAKYAIKYNTSKNCAVNIIDKTAKGGKGEWIARVDLPHKGANFEHININPKVSGVADPHIKLPAGGVAAATSTAKVAQTINKINKVAVPVAVAVDTAMVGYSVYKDVQNGTSRNTVETAASVTGGWGGGYGGATAGAAIGTAIFPGIGTIVGAIIGGIGGGVGGSLAAGAVVDVIGDELEYDIEWRRCESCGQQFKAKEYKGEKICQKCRG